MKLSCQLPTAQALTHVDEGQTGTDQSLKSNSKSSLQMTAEDKRDKDQEISISQSFLEHEQVPNLDEFFQPDILHRGAKAAISHKPREEAAMKLATQSLEIVTQMGNEEEGIHAKEEKATEQKHNEAAATQE